MIATASAEPHFADLTAAAIAEVLPGRPRRCIYMTFPLKAWDRLRSSELALMHAMALIWMAFTVMLFAIDQMLLEWLLARRAATAP
jgi:hypothetical protein